MPLAAQQVGGGAHGLDRLQAVDRRHDARIGVLDAEARRLKPRAAYRSTPSRRSGGAGRSDGDLGRPVALEGGVDGLEDAAHLVAAEDGRRAAAEMDRVQPLARRWAAAASAISATSAST